jgi:single-strand DNA-binding protein
MSTFFVGEGNIGSDPQFLEFPNGNEEPRRLLKLNVRFDNPVPVKDGFQDRGGFWAPVEIWNANAENWADLYQKGMRVIVQGRMVSQEWQKEGEKRVTYKIEARSVGILPHRVLSIAIEPKGIDNMPEPPSGE